MTPENHLAHNELRESAVPFLNALNSEATEIRFFTKRDGSAKPLIERNFYGRADKHRLLADVEQWDEKTSAIYYSAQVITPELLSRQTRRPVSKADCVKDTDVTHFRLFPIDVDPPREPGTNATAEELEAARVRAEQIRHALTELGIPANLLMSGNGWHLIVFIELLENTHENDKRFKALGDRVASHWGTDGTIYNAGRILKLPGTMARKGPHSEERPHRRSYRVPQIDPTRISFEALEAKVVRFIPCPEPIPETTPKIKIVSDTTPPARYKAANETVLELLARCGQQVLGSPKTDSKGRTLYELVVCPFDPTDAPGDACVMEDADGTRAFKCHHHSCAQYGWKDFRRAVDPDYERPYLPRNTPSKTKPPQPEGDGPTPDLPRRVANGKQIVSLSCEDEEFGVQLRTVDEVADEVFPSITSDPKFVMNAGMLGAIRDTGEGVFAWEPTTEKSLTADIAKKCLFIEPLQKRIKTHAKPPKHVVEHILHGQDFEGIPHLGMILQYPYLFQGEIRNLSGLDPRTGHYRPEQTMIELTEFHSSEEAVAVFKDNVFKDFPFATAADFENALAAVITLLIKPSFPLGAMMPAYMITAASQGTGKSELAKAILGSVLPYPDVFKVKKDETEIEKEILACLRASRNYLLIDNVPQDRPMSSSTLASLISEPTHSGRLLGGNVLGTFRNHMFTLFTGNNLDASAELVDRAVCVKLISPPERSDMRDFRHENLQKYLFQKRGMTLGAAIYMIKKWVGEGSPKSNHRHRMRQWAKAVGGVLQANGLGENFLDNMKDFRLEQDQESVIVGRAFEAIYEDNGEKPWTTSDVFTIVSYERAYYDGTDTGQVHAFGENLLGDLYVDSPNSDPDRKKRVGRVIAKRVGQTLNGLTLLEAGKMNRVRAYRLVKVD